MKSLFFKSPNPYRIPRGQHYYFDKTISDLKSSIVECLYDLSDVAIKYNFDIIEKKYLYCEFTVPKIQLDDRLKEIKDRIKDIDKDLRFIIVLNRPDGNISLLFTYDENIDISILKSLAKNTLMLKRLI